MRFDTHVSLIHTSSRVPILIMAIHLTTAKRLGPSMRSNQSMKRGPWQPALRPAQVRGHRRPLVPALSDPVHLPLRLHQREQELPVPAARAYPQVVRGDPQPPRRVARHPAVAGGSWAGDAGRHGARHSGGGSHRPQPLLRPGGGVAVAGAAHRPARHRHRHRAALRLRGDGDPSASGPSSSVTPPSAWWWSTTMPWRAFAAPTRASSRRRWISGPTASRPCAT